MALSSPPREASIGSSSRTWARDRHQTATSMTRVRPTRVPVCRLVYEALAVGIHNQSSISQGPVTIHSESSATAMWTRALRRQHVGHAITEVQFLLRSSCWTSALRTHALWDACKTLQHHASFVSLRMSTTLLQFPHINCMGDNYSTTHTTIAGNTITFIPSQRFRRDNTMVSKCSFHSMARRAAK